MMNFKDEDLKIPEEFAGKDGSIKWKCCRKGRNASEVWGEDSRRIKNLRLKYKKKQEVQTDAKAKLSGISASFYLDRNDVRMRCCLDCDKNKNIVFILDIYAIRRYNSKTTKTY